MIARRAITVVASLSSIFVPNFALAAPKKNQPDTRVSIRHICSGLPDFLENLKNVPADQQPNLNYPVLIFREYGRDTKTSTPALFWKPGKESIAGKAFYPLHPKSFTPISYTTEPLLILTCHVGSETPPDPDVNNVDVTPPPEEAMVEEQARVAAGKKPKKPTPAANRPVEKFDKIKIDAVKDNTITYIYFYHADAATDPGLVEVLTTKPDAPAPKSAADLAGPAKKADGTPAADPPKPVVAWAVVERHKVVHFSIGGGFVAFHGQAHTYSAVTTPTAITTQTCNGKLVTTQTGATSAAGPSGGSSGANGYGYNPCSASLPSLNLGPNTVISSYESDVTNGSTVGTANYALQTIGQPWQVDALAGLTVYPFGHDTYGPSIGRGFDFKYGFTHWKNSTGIFLGTSVNNFGNFTGGLAYEVFPGMQVMAGSTFWSKISLASGLTACTGLGNSPSFSIAPNSNEDDIAIAYTPSSTTNNVTTPGTNVITETKKSTTTTATSGCTNGDKASMISGTTVPTTSAYKPAFSIGIIFNSNLSKAFSGIFK
jgi:hypothetical protein